MEKANIPIDPDLYAELRAYCDSCGIRFMDFVEDALEQANLRIVNVEGHPFDPGMAATPLNIEEFDTKDALIVDQMLEPIIMGKEGLIKTGTVTLRKVEL